jgi:hypothetical protein
VALTLTLTLTLAQAFGLAPVFAPCMCGIPVLG